MSEVIPRSLQEVWDWKRRDEEATADLDRDQVMDYYSKGAAEVERKLALGLTSVPAAEVPRRHADRSSQNPCT